MHTILAARSTFSIGEAIYSIDKLVEDAANVGAKAVALTDTMSVTAMIEFTKAAKKKGLKPVIGCRLRVVDDPTWRKVKGEKAKAPPAYFPTAYVLSETGLKAIFRLLSKANSPDRFYEVAKISFDDLAEELSALTSADLAITTGDVLGVLHHPSAETIVRSWVDQLGAGNVFANLTPIDAPVWDTFNARSAALANKLGISTLVTRPTCYSEGEADAADVMHAIATNRTMDSEWRNQPYWRDLTPMVDRDLAKESVRAAERLRARYGLTNAGAVIKQGLEATSRLVDLVTYEWTKAPVSLPKMAENEFATLVEECRKGWKLRFADVTFGHQPSMDELRDIYRPRLAYELQVLKTLEFAGYFLLVQDVVRFAKSNGILVGPGRGSVGGSLVAYLVGITDCDPIRFGLLFERFINPDRIDLPDADLDFMSERRHEIVDYLIKTYGQNRVAGVSNFNALGPASAIRDVSRVFGLPEQDYACSKFAPKEHGQSIKLVKAAEITPEIGAFRDAKRPLWDVMLKLEGKVRNMGQHAAGIVVGGVDLVERAVLERRKGDETVVCWDKRIVEEQGLVKMDILGLSTLDLIDLTLRYVRERHGKRIDILKIPLDDPKVLGAFAIGMTTGVFQFESGGMRRLLKELGKDGTITFDDITAATALYRPGPMESGMMDSYWKRKQGLEDVEYDHPDMEPILKPTFGVMVYQEQVMQVARVIAGYSAPDADKLRKIMGKKLPEEMAKERGKFVEGCVKTIGCDEEWAGELFDKIEGFAGYGFNKSHSVEYTLISYQSMWLKVNYPVEFVAAALSLMKDEKLGGLLSEAKRLGIEIVMPDINNSTGRFEILTDTKLCIPFNRIKGISDNTTNAILEARKGGKFTSIADLQARVERRKCNVRHVEILNRVGAFARIEPGQKPSDHPDRIRDQVELVPGLVDDVVPINRSIGLDKFDKAKLAALISDYRTEQAQDGMPVAPTLGKAPRFMVITDAPTSAEERLGKLAFGDSFAWVQEALSENGLSRADAYWTSMLKRPKAGKQISAEEIGIYLPYLKREIELIKPPVIVLLGSQTVRHFMPDFRGKASDAAGTVVYNAELDANLIIGFNPGEIYHDNDKQVALNEVFAVAARISE